MLHENGLFYATVPWSKKLGGGGSTPPCPCMGDLFFFRKQKIEIRMLHENRDTWGMGGGYNSMPKLGYVGW